MSKTNFKCMYLVDDRFYKKAIDTNTFKNHSAPPGSTLSKNIVYIPTHVNDEIETLSVPAPSSNQSEQHRISHIQTPPKTVVQSDLETSSSSYRRGDKTIPIYDHMMSEPLSTSEKSMEVSEPQCACQDTCSPTSENKVQETRVPNYGGSSAIGEQKKKTQDNEDLELVERQERFRKIREDIDLPPKSEDIDYPPPKPTQKVNIDEKKTGKLKNIQIPPPQKRKKFIAQTSGAQENQKVTYVCTICRAKFKRMNTLTRHMQNIHGEFFDNEGKGKKRKNVAESSQQQKKFISDGRQKRNMIGGENSQKRTRQEFKCPLCKDYFKTEAALHRHGINVHDLNSLQSKGKKRKEFQGKNLPRQYVKRHKNDAQTPIEYVNYF